MFQAGVGVLVELLSLVPSLLLVQLFRRIKQRTSDQQKLAAVYAAIRQTDDRVASESRPDKKKRCELIFPWWCIFVAYALSLIMVGVSILFIIARGIEFGDVKTQKWLVSLIIGLFSSIFITQPLKVSRHFPSLSKNIHWPLLFAGFLFGRAVCFLLSQ